MVGGPCIHAAQRAYLDGAPDSGPLLDTLVFQPRDDFRDRYAEPNGTVFIDTFSDAGSYALALSFRQPNALLPCGLTEDCGGGVTTSPAFSETFHGGRYGD